MVPTVWCSGRYFLHGKIQKATVLRTQNSAVTPCYGKTSICATKLIFFFFQISKFIFQNLLFCRRIFGSASPRPCAKIRPVLTGLRWRRGIRWFLARL
jgi:hypothetical protein